MFLFILDLSHYNIEMLGDFNLISFLLGFDVADSALSKSYLLTPASI